MWEQTAIDFFIQKILEQKIKFIYTDMGVMIDLDEDVIREAKYMERDQIMNAYRVGIMHEIQTEFGKQINGNYQRPITEEEYYKNIYGEICYEITK